MSSTTGKFSGSSSRALDQLSTAAQEGAGLADAGALSGGEKGDPAAEIAGESGGGAVMQAGPEHPTRLDRFLAEQRPGVPFSFVQKLIRMRKVRIQKSDGVWVRETTPGRHLDEGMLVRVYSKLFDEGKAPDNGAAHLPVLRDIQRIRDAVLYEDHDCIVINKPSGLAVQGGSKIAKGRHLDVWMQHVVGVPVSGEQTQKPRLVHRLDRETSGCLIVAKTRVASALFASAFKEGRVEKV